MSQRRGGGRGARGRGAGPGRMGGPYAAGPGGNCICPSCGKREPHSPGIPCTSQKCSKCGALMIRE